VWAGYLQGGTGPRRWTRSSWSVFEKLAQGQPGVRGDTQEGERRTISSRQESLPWRGRLLRERGIRAGTLTKSNEKNCINIFL